MGPTRTTHTRTTQNSRRAAALSSLSATRHQDPSTVVQTFRGFSQRRTDDPRDIGSSISALQNRDYPQTPTRPTPGATAPPEGGPPDDGPPDDDGGPPDSDSDDGEDLYGDLFSETRDSDYEDPDLPPESRVLLQLSHAINRLSTSTHRNDDHSAKTKVREPDTFDGTEPRKLRAFLVQCELNFQSRPSTYRNDRTKITFAQSYLKGMALEWFEPDLLSSDAPDDRPLWMDDYTEFMTELQQNFGPHDPQGDAEAQLEQLDMRDGHRINKYIVEFQRLASQVRGYGDGALRRQFYSGLPPRIKDEVSRVGKPDSLTELKALAQTIDARYWERKGEVSRESKSTTSSYAVKQSTITSSSGQKPSSSSSSKPSTFSGASSSKGPDLSEKLGKDGRLTADERKRRLEKKLCLFCGGPGHSARDCTKSTSRAAKARAATVTPSSTPEAKPEVSSETKK